MHKTTGRLLRSPHRTPLPSSHFAADGQSARPSASFAPPPALGCSCHHYAPVNSLRASGVHRMLTMMALRSRIISARSLRGTICERDSCLARNSYDGVVLLRREDGKNMTQAWTSIGLAVLLSGGAFGQAGITASETPAPAFEAADVHVSPKVRVPSMAAGGLRGTRYLVRQATLVDLISLAYGIDNDKILGGPNWLDLDRFDVSARAPAGSTPEQAKLMLQTLLAQRFSLKVHNDSKELPGFVLSAGSGKTKMKPAADAAASPNCQGQPQAPSPDTVPQQVVECHSMSWTIWRALLSIWRTRAVAR